MRLRRKVEFLVKENDFYLTTFTRLLLLAHFNWKTFT